MAKRINVSCRISLVDRLSFRDENAVESYVRDKIYKSVVEELTGETELLTRQVDPLTLNTEYRFDVYVLTPKEYERLKAIEEKYAPKRKRCPCCHGNNVNAPCICVT